MEGRRVQALAAVRVMFETEVGTETVSESSGVGNMVARGQPGVWGVGVTRAVWLECGAGSVGWCMLHLCVEGVLSSAL